MREFVFSMAYDPGKNPVADVLAAYPDTRIRSLSCHVTPDSLFVFEEQTKFGMTITNQSVLITGFDEGTMISCIDMDDQDVYRVVEDRYRQYRRKATRRVAEMI